MKPFALWWTPPSVRALRAFSFPRTAIWLWPSNSGETVSPFWGEVDIPTVLSPGPVERIREETRKCIDQAAGRRRLRDDAFLFDTPGRPP